MKNRIKKFAASVALIAAPALALTGGIQVAAVATAPVTAPAAEAYYLSGCFVHDAGYGYGYYGYRYIKYCKKTSVTWWDYLNGHRNGQLVPVRYGHTWSQAWGW